MLKKHIVSDGIKLEVDEDGILVKDENGNVIEVLGRSEEFTADESAEKSLISKIEKSTSDTVIKTMNEILSHTKAETRTAKKDSIFAKEVGTDKETSIESEDLQKSLTAFKEKGGNFSFVQKTLSLSGSFTGEIPEEDRETSVNVFKRENIDVMTLSEVIPTTSNQVTYVAQINETGAPATTAELALYPEIDFEYSVISAKVEKISVLTRMSVESVDDLPEITRIVKATTENRLTQKVTEKLIVGTGVNDITGVYTQAPIVNTASLTGTVYATSVVTPTNFDAITVVQSVIKEAGEGNFTPNVILLNPANASLMKMQKDANGNVIPQSIAFSTNGTIDGLKVIESKHIPQGEFFVGDMKSFVIRPRSGVLVTLTNSNKDEFEKDIVSMKVSQRLATYVRANDNGAFAKGNFTDIKTVITA
jgi:HK97 family phage major capsid protein